MNAIIFFYIYVYDHDRKKYPIPSSLNDTELDGEVVSERTEKISFQLDSNVHISKTYFSWSNIRHHRSFESL